VWKIEESIPKRVNKSGFDLEKDLEHFIKTEPALLDGESLLIIGQQVLVIGVNDKIDLLAIDTNGSAVIIEVKRGKVRDPDELQSIRYVSYVSNWGHDAFEEQANRFYAIPEHLSLLQRYMGNPEATYDGLVQTLDSFCDEDYELNTDQRIILVGTEIGDKVLSVLAWLNKKGINIKFVQLECFEDKGSTYIIPRTVFPLPKQEEMAVGTAGATETEPWKIDGKKWHLEKRVSQDTAALLSRIIDDLESLEEVEGTSWSQKFYVAVKADRRNWLFINTFPNQLNIEVTVARASIKPQAIADIMRIGVDRVEIEEKGQRDHVKTKLKPTDEYDTKSFQEFAQMMIDAFRRA